MNQREILDEIAASTTPRFNVSDLPARERLSRAKADPIERFLSKVDKSGGPEACWPWTGNTVRFQIDAAPDPRGGTYKNGVRRKKNRAVSFRMFMYEITYGEKAPKKIFPEKCGNGQCCNPLHFGFHHPPLIGASRLRMTNYMEPRKRMLGLVQPTPANETPVADAAGALALIVKTLDSMDEASRLRVLAAVNAFYGESL